MAGRPPEELVEQFVKDTHQMTTHELSKHYQIAESTVRDWRLYCKRQLNKAVGYGLEFVDKKEEPTTLDDKEMWALMTKLSQKRDRERKAQDHLTIDLTENLPYGVALIGDLHCGIEGVKYDDMDLDFATLSGLPGVLAIGMGDYAHNPKTRMKPGESLYRMILPDPEDQYRMAMFQMEKLDGQWIGLIKGCHDDWDYQVAGVERVAGLAKFLGTAYLGHGAVIHISLGDCQYTILARHKYKYNSNVNVTNAQRRAWEQVEQADVIAFAHLHSSVSHKETRGSQEVVYARSGSYFEWDEFGMKIGHYQGQRGVPLLILYPDEKRIVPFYGGDLDEGLRFLEYERQYYTN